MEREDLEFDELDLIELENVKSVEMYQRKMFEVTGGANMRVSVEDEEYALVRISSDKPFSLRVADTEAIYSIEAAGKQAAKDISEKVGYNVRYPEKNTHDMER